ncbi:unnamed protein product [Rotaria magnacalcarata]|uniref:BED-type domain-containing protein n=1 Tax=Rotaria magnacalcarata TaxID=392030 RepID=A0A816WWU0_9BILA|nr:unnamed protein product [Rotaria magnacalcarata]CAF4400892.1 unnamed protein product [Rotaria magnacalcarata]
MVSKLLKRDQLEFVLKNNDKSIKLKKFEQTDRGSSLLPAFNQILVNGVVQIFVLCDKCRSIITYKSTTGTGGLKKHLASCEKMNPHQVQHNQLSKRIIEIINRPYQENLKNK